MLEWRKVSAAIIALNSCPSKKAESDRDLSLPGPAEGHGARGGEGSTRCRPQTVKGFGMGLSRGWKRLTEYTGLQLTPEC